MTRVPSGSHAPGGGVRMVVQLPGGIQDSLSGLGADTHAGDVIQDERDGGARDTGMFGHVARTDSFSGHRIDTCY